MAKRRIGGAGGGSDKGSGGGLAAAGVAVVALGALSTGAVGTSAGVAGSSAGSSAGGSSVGESFSVRKAESKKSARKGDSDAAWRRMGLREVKRVSKQDAECLAASHGQVREFFLRTPCASLDRVLLTVFDDEGNSAVVSVAWVGFRTNSEVSSFKTVIDRQGSGDVRPLVDVADIRFSGLNYGSETTGKGITIAEAETATGSVAPDVLDAMSEVAALFPRP